MHSLLSTLTIFVFLYFGAMLNVSADKKQSEKYLCITSSSSGALYQGGTQQGQIHKPGAEFIVSTKSGKVKSVKEFGRKDDRTTYSNCTQIAKTTTFICRDKLDVFEFQLSARRFVMTKTSGYTSNNEDSDIKHTPAAFKPNISVGECGVIKLDSDKD